MQGLNPQTPAQRSVEGDGTKRVMRPDILPADSWIHRRTLRHIRAKTTLAQAPK